MVVIVFLSWLIPPFHERCRLNVLYRHSIRSKIAHKNNKVTYKHNKPIKLPNKYISIYELNYLV